MTFAPGWNAGNVRMRIEWSNRAVADLNAISEYVEHDRNLETANRVARAIYDGDQRSLIRSVAHSN